MRISVLGKGGSGKSTVSASLILYLKSKFKSVLAIDADINEHLADLIKAEKPTKTIGHHYKEIFDYLFFYRKNKDKLAPLGCIPLSNDTRFTFLHDRSFLLSQYATKKDNIYFGIAGKYEPTEVGVTCFHTQLYALELFLNNIIDNEDELIVIDSNAGIDNITTSLVFTSDLYIFVVEPTLKSIQVYQDYKKLTSLFNINLKVIVNKFKTEDDDFINKHLNKEEIIGFIKDSTLLKLYEQGDTASFDLFLKTNQTTWEEVYKEIKNSPLPRWSNANLINHYKDTVQHFYPKKNLLESEEKLFFNPSFDKKSVFKLNYHQYFNQCYLNEASPYRKSTLSFLHKQAPVGSFLEIGSGSMPWFWALATLNKATSITFSDYSPELISNYDDFIEELNIEKLRGIHTETINFLTTNHIWEKDNHLKNFFDNLVKKTSFEKYDFLSGPYLQQFDCIYGIEAIELINTEEELKKAFENIFLSLKSNGVFLGNTFPYDFIDSYVNNLRSLNLEGDLNPNQSTLDRIAKEAGFRETYFEIHSFTKAQPGPYQQAIYFKFIK